ncbi:MAG: hypothetical protein Q9170_005595 [Blastenia crenularia]
MFLNVECYQHKEFMGPDGQMHPPTGANYQNYFIVAGSKSTIVARNNASPRHTAAPGQLIPALNRWSDVVWQNWTGLASTQANQPRYVIHDSIYTLATRQLIEYIEVAEPDD